MSCSIQEKKNLKERINNQCPKCKPDSVKSLLVCGNKETKYLDDMLKKYKNIGKVEFIGDESCDWKRIFLILNKYNKIENLIISKGLKTIPREISLLKNVKSIYLNYNDICTSEINNYNTSVKNLYLGSNNLGKLSNDTLSLLLENISKYLNELEYIDLSSNNLTSLPLTLNEFSKLNSIQAVYNNLSKFPCELLNINNLNKLNIDYYPEIMDFPLCLDNFPKGFSIYFRQTQEVDTIMYHKLIKRYPNIRFSGIAY